MTHPADPLDAALEQIRAGAEMFDTGYAALVHYTRNLREAYAAVCAENQRLTADNRQLRGMDDDLDQTTPLPRVGPGRRRAPRGLRRKQGPPIAAHSHRKPTSEHDQEARHR